MNDDLQDQINAQLKKASSTQPEALKKSDEDGEFEIKDPNTTPKPFAKNTPQGKNKPEDPDDNDLPKKTFDLSEIELSSTPPKRNEGSKDLTSTAPKSIADLLHIEREVAKNPPKASSNFFPSSVARKENGEMFGHQSSSYASTNEETYGTQAHHINSSVKKIEYTPKGASPIVRKLRTLKGDIEEAMKSGKATLVSVAVAEQDRKAEEYRKAPESSPKPQVEHPTKSATMVMPRNESVSAKSPPTKANVAPIRPEKIPSQNASTGTKITAMIMSVILIGGGVFGVYYVMKKQAEPVVIIENESIPKAFIEVTYQIPIETDDRNPSYVRATYDAERRRTSSKLNEVGETVFLTGKGEAERALDSSEFFNKVAMTPPSDLIRTLDKHFTAGFHNFGGNYGFLMFKTDSYDVARAAMLDWEDKLEDEVGKFLRSPIDFAYATATDATVNRRSFKDKVYKNLDTRAILDDNGKPLFIYAFINREFLVMVADPETLSAINLGLTSIKVTK